ncbi:TetR/AcrR family transcriptional regulator [Kutzneria sp. NPDC052558]|uniref:TetR/AcrR family transcriptional regulator n=1 Tax=Kutzneria sp. NPDC052558 TaxID=3364121 RepID=UPI0037CBC758
MEAKSSSPLRPRVWSLPAGRHGLARELVSGSQRERLLYGVMMAAAELGYAATTVADVLERAGVSRKTFYQHFTDKLECFLAAHEVGRDAMMAAVFAVIEQPLADPVAQLRAVNLAYLCAVADEPAFAKAFFIEIYAAGPEARDRRVECRRQLADLLRLWHSSLPGRHPEYRPVPASAFDAAMGAADTLATDYLRAHPADGLAALEPDISYAILAVLGLPEAAAAL